ncbi:CHAT domain-containing protein [Bowmanella dokdonensis]|uniref:CHAT domain-containing protein n=1 Tax=Bowmanella dokdonensis TaxID=751969 RepID=A0A939DP00_9ALTE|nr:CHAT domain-containing protein [Bowmanella dokdonensis]
MQIHSGDTAFIVNQPLGRSGSEYAYLPASAKGALACLYPYYANGALGSWEFIEHTLITDAQMQDAQWISDAGKHWNRDNAPSRLRAIELYQGLARASSTLPGIQEMALSSAILANVFRYSFSAAKALLADISLSEDRWTPYRHLLLGARAKIEMEQGNLDAARKQILKAIEAAQSGQLPLEMAELFTLAGLIELLDLNLTEGQVWLGKAEKHASGDNRLLALINSNRSFVEILQSRGSSEAEQNRALGRSLLLEEKAAALAELALDRRTLAKILNNLGYVNERHRALRAALDYYTRALAIVSQMDDPEFNLLLLRNLGTVNLSLGDHNKAASFLLSALRITNEDNRRESALIRCRLAKNFHKQQRVLEAQSYFQACLDTGVQLDDAELIVAASIGLMHTAPSPHDYLHKALDQLPRLRDPDLTTRLYLALASDQSQRADWQQSAEAMRAAEAAALTTRDPTIEVEVLHQAMQLAVRQGKLSLAIKKGFEAISRIETMHQHLEAQRYGPAWSNLTNRIYRELAEALWQEAEKPEDIKVALLDLSERMRSVSLRQHLSRPERDPQDDLDLEQLEQISQLANQSAGQQQQGLPLSYYLIQTLQSGRYFKDIRQPAPDLLNVQEIQASLGSNQLILNYLVLDQRLILLAISQQDIDIQAIPMTAATLQDRAERLRKTLVDGKAPGRKDLASLASLLPRPLLANGQFDELILIAHRSLHQLPFAALPIDDAGTALVERFKLRGAPSINTLLMAKSGQASLHGSELVIFADPTFNSPGGQSIQGQETVRTWAQTLRPLDYTGIEAQRIESLFPAGQVLSFTGTRANRRNLHLEQVRQARVLHFATHGYFNPDQPDNMGLQLAGVDETGQPIAGFVTLPELFAYPFANQLVVINGCDTAMGKQQAGEGMVGLVRGFLAQGARQVLSTLWPVADRASAQFMEYFYASLLQQGSAGEALRDAQLKLRANPRYRNPYYWAPYVLHSADLDDRIGFTASGQAALTAVPVTEELTSFPHAEEVVVPEYVGR